MIVKRKCATCGEIKDRSEFIKITRVCDNGEIVVEPDSNTFGRSVYLCKNENCIKGAFKKDRIFKVLKTKRNDSLQNKILETLEN